MLEVKGFFIIVVVVGNAFSECAPVTLEDPQRINSKRGAERIQNIPKYTKYTEYTKYKLFPSLDNDNMKNNLKKPEREFEGIMSVSE